MDVRDCRTVHRLPSSMSRRFAERRPGSIGHITLRGKCAGARSAGKPHAACDVAGAGNGLTVRLVRHSHRKRGETDRPRLRSTAPALDPTGLARATVSNIRSIVLDAIAFARNLCALAAENLFLRKQLTFFVERKQAPRRTDNATRFTMATVARLFDGRKPLSWSSPIRSFCGTGKGFGCSGVGSLGQKDVQRCQRS